MLPTSSIGRTIVLVTFPSVTLMLTSIVSPLVKSERAYVSASVVVIAFIDTMRALLLATAQRSVCAFIIALTSTDAVRSRKYNGNQITASIVVEAPLSHRKKLEIYFGISVIPKVDFRTARLLNHMRKQQHSSPTLRMMEQILDQNVEFTRKLYDDVSHACGKYFYFGFNHLDTFAPKLFPL